MSLENFPLRTEDGFERKDVAEELHQAAEVLGMTNIVEAELEERAHKSGFKFGNFFRVLVAGLAIGGIAEQVSAQNVEEVQKEILHNTGYDLVSYAKKADFEVDVEIGNGDGEYIVDIGQTHYVPGAEKHPEILIQSQKNIEKILTSIYEKDKKPFKVYCEGVSSSLLQEEYTRLNESLSKIKLENGTMIEMALACQDFLDKNQYKPTVQTSFIYLYKTKMSETLRYFKDHPHEYKKRDDVRTTPEGWQIKGSDSAQEEYDTAEALVHEKFSSLKNDAIYMAGTDLKLAIDGKIILAPAESREGNRGAFEDKAEIESLGKKIDELLGSVKNVNTSDEKTKIYDQIDMLREKREDLIKNQDAKVTTNREKIAIQKIDEDPKRGKIDVLLFGVAHDFTGSVSEYNTEHPDKKIGLIKLKPIFDSLPNEKAVESK